MQGLKYVRPLTWEEVFSAWSKEESHLSHWIEHYTQRGFTTWQDWRRSSVDGLHPEQLKWDLFEIEDNGIIGEFYGGPFRAWQAKYYGQDPIIPFAELARSPELQGDATINEIIQNFPKESTLVGLRKDGKMIVIEGMHRCSALVVAKEKGVHIEAKLHMALADFPDPLPTLGQANSPT